MAGPAQAGADCGPPIVPVIVPVLFAGLLNAHGNLGPAEIPAKRRYLFRDVMREAARCGLPFRGPPGHPFNPLLPLRVLTAVDDDGARLRLARTLLAACWEVGQDIADAGVVRDVIDAAGGDGAGLLARGQQPDIKARLAEATADAAAAGIFGVPTLRIDGDDELFWGADRIEALRWRLAGNTIDTAALDAFVARPAAAQRRR